ncbi:hypothetical protein AK812_SmicGene1379 [Symbiodinium microadriaticum]|uniref:Uncharacterized protein n=1 Tax=Symbiodinium microadriaticum TaxID=2951 RepID=A0A1Q9F439_SYMMI|nr:hypothetical protein AK812_SmicGene1379 [Symbiodinium microadriaticum]
MSSTDAGDPAGPLLIVIPGRSGREPVLRRLVAEVGPVAVLVPARFASYCAWAHSLAAAWIEFGSPGGAPTAPICADEAWEAVSRWMAAGGPKPLGCTTWDEWGIEICAHLCAKERLNLPYTPLETVRQVRNKARFREACVKGGVPAPRFANIHSKAESSLPSGCLSTRGPVPHFAVVPAPGDKAPPNLQSRPLAPAAARLMRTCSALTSGPASCAATQQVTQRVQALHDDDPAVPEDLKPGLVAILAHLATLPLSRPAAWTFPVILKPAKGAGSYYCLKAESEDHLLEAFPRLNESLLGEQKTPQEDAAAGWVLEARIGKP